MGPQSKAHSTVQQLKVNKATRVSMCTTVVVSGIVNEDNIWDTQGTPRNHSLLNNVIRGLISQVFQLSNGVTTHFHRLLFIIIGQIRAPWRTRGCFINVTHMYSRSVREDSFNDWVSWSFKTSR